MKKFLVLALVAMVCATGFGKTLDEVLNAFPQADNVQRMTLDKGMLAMAMSAGGEQAKLMKDIDENYPNVEAKASAESDRGALRIKVWGEKVTRMLSSLVQRYLEEGEEMLKDTQIWVCTICGFVYVGDEPPAMCPVCKVPSWKFKRMEARA